MPTYEYKCSKCGREFEVVQKISSKAGAKCPRCGGKSQRQLSAAGLVFKGSGFYITDYKRKGEKTDGDAAPAKSSDAPAATPAAKPAETTSDSTPKPKKKKDD